MFPTPFNSINFLLITTLNFTPIHVYPRLKVKVRCALHLFYIPVNRSYLQSSIRSFHRGFFDFLKSYFFQHKALLSITYVSYTALLTYNTYHTILTQLTKINSHAHAYIHQHITCRSKSNIENVVLDLSIIVARQPEQR